MAETINKAGEKAREDNARLANELKGTRYEGMTKENPYLKQEYQNGLWDKLGDWMGFRTKQDQWREQMEMASNEYNAQIASLKSEDEYNSPAAKAAREQEAGLNPDLIGTGDAENAAAMTEPETRPEIPGGANEDLNQVAGTIMTIATSAMGMVQSGMNIGLLANEVEAGKISNAGYFLDIARRYVLENIDPNDYEGPQGQKKYELALARMLYNEGMSEDGKKVAVENIDDWTRQNFPNARMRRKVELAITRVGKSLPTEIEKYKLWHQRESERQGYNKLRASSGYDQNDDVMRDFWKTIEQPLEAFAKEQAEYNYRKEHKLNELGQPEQEALTENKKSEADYDDQAARKSTAKLWKELLDGCDKMIEKGGLYETWGRALKIATLLGQTLVQKGISIGL